MSMNCVSLTEIPNLSSCSEGEDAPDEQVSEDTKHKKSKKKHKHKKDRKKEKKHKKDSKKVKRSKLDSETLFSESAQPTSRNPQVTTLVVDDTPAPAPPATASTKEAGELDESTDIELVELERQQELLKLQLEREEQTIAASVSSKQAQITGRQNGRGNDEKVKHELKDKRTRNNSTECDERKEKDVKSQHHVRVKREITPHRHTDHSRHEDGRTRSRDVGKSRRSSRSNVHHRSRSRNRTPPKYEVVLVMSTKVPAKLFFFKSTSFHT